MSQLPTRGPLNQFASPRLITDGTTPRNNGSVPGPQCVSRPSGITDFNRRLKNLKRAFALGIKKYAYQETVAKLGSDLKLIIDSLWPAFVQTLEIYAKCIGAGAVVFGVIGAIIGEGVGAVPGAIFGAQIGADVATVILAYLGLKFLAEYVLSHMTEANRHFKAGFNEAWQACGNDPPLDHSGREFGRAIAELFSLMLEAAVAWLLKKGLKAGLKELNKSETGKILAAYATVEYWRKKLGVTDAEIPRKGIKTTVDYFDEQVKNKKLNEMSEEDLLSYWKAMDFSKAVTVENLKPGKILVGYRFPDQPNTFGFYYAEPGAYIDKLGIDYLMDKKLERGVQGPLQRVPREFIRYRVKTAVEALKSTTSGVKAHDTKQLAPGGSTQYFIPRSWEVLEVIENPTPKPK